MSNLHTHTPSLMIIDPRSLPARLITCYRAASEAAVQLRVTRQTYDAAGRLITQQDPQLPTPNSRTTYSLSGKPVLTDSVDAGWRLILSGDAGQLLQAWDGRDTERHVEYDELLRPVVISETDDTMLTRITFAPRSMSTERPPSRASLAPTLVVERFTYGGPQATEHNQCNQLMRHDDPAGTRHLRDYSVLGAVLSEARHFMLATVMPDWPLAESERDTLVEIDALNTRWAFNALGEAIEQTDAMGNRQHFSQTVAGQLKSVDLTLASAAQPQVLVRDIRYNAFGQTESETAVNGVVSTALYRAEDGRLIELKASLAADPALQHLNYAYDPVGNITQIEDAAQPVRFFANQRVEAINQYRYDTLYQLIEATGREVRTGASHGPALPDLQTPPDPSQLANYTQTYNYDAAGNLLEMRHVGAQSFTRTMRVAPDSNRSLPEGDVDVDFAEAFDANGNLQQLIRGQAMMWDRRNQLRQIILVQRDEHPSDTETYIYDGNGQRCRKISSAQASGRTLINEVRYLPGLEIRRTADGEILHVISAQAGRSSVRVLHWQAGQPAGVANDQLRYSLDDHLGSSTLELDAQGRLISQESYYPFGGTAWWAARSAIEAKYKTIRYSGKERDASGLYYYGFRYYAPWLQRWINPDPAGDVDGLNVYCFVGNSPVSSRDRDGRMKDSSAPPPVVSRPPPLAERPSAIFSRPAPPETWRLDRIISQADPDPQRLRGIHQKLLDSSDAEDHPALTDYIEQGHAAPNADLRQLETNPQHQLSDDTTELLGSFKKMTWMSAKSFMYRSIKVQPAGLEGLKEKGRWVADLGVQSATVTKRSAMNWGKAWAGDASSATENVMFVFSMDIPRINLASGLFADHVAVLPGEKLEVVESITATKNNQEMTYVLLGKPADSVPQRPVHSLFTGEIISTYADTAKRLKAYSPMNEP